MHRMILALALALVGFSPVHAQVLELKLGNTASPGSLQQIAAEEYARRVNEKLAGKVHVTVFGNSQLGNENELLQKLKIGSVDFSMPSTIMSTVSATFGVFDMPYLIKDRAHMARFRDRVFWQDLAPTTEKQGIRIVSVVENGFRQITNNVRPINTPDDLKGIKLRVPPGIWRTRMFQAYGANPSPMQFSELFVALQTGVMDGQENPLTNIWSAKLHEVQKYLSMTNHIYSPSFIAVGVNRWNRIDPALRDQLEAIGREIQDWVLEQGEKEDRGLFENLRKAGIQINEANREAFVRASAPIYDEFGKQVPGGHALIEKALALANP